MNKDWNGNYNSIWKTLGASNHTSEERETNDFYATDPVAVDKLMRSSINFSRTHQIWECACGQGHLSNTLKYWYMYDTFTSDIIKRFDEQDAVIDFLQATKYNVPFKNDFDILTNPPYKYAQEFVEKSMELLPINCKCFMFLKLSFLEGKKRKKLFEKYPPLKVLVFSERIMCAKNGDFEKMRNGGGSAVAYAWFVWKKGYKGETTIEWI